jgi:alkylhydroperoxidase family enzyme
MARIGKIEREGATGETERLFQAAEALLGRAPNFYRYLANSPLVAKMLLPFNAVLQRQGGGSVLPARIKEMVVIKTSAVNGCAYCYAHNTSLGEHVTRNTASDRDDVFAELRAHFNDAEIVELTLISGMFNMFNRFMDSLRVPLEPQDEIDKIKRSLDLDTENVRAYFQTVLDNWPEEFPSPAAEAAE